VATTAPAVYENGLLRPAECRADARCRGVSTALTAAEFWLNVVP
jgi:hypothetical protein